MTVGTKERESAAARPAAKRRLDATELPPERNTRSRKPLPAELGAEQLLKGRPDQVQTKAEPPPEVVRDPAKERALLTQYFADAFYRQQCPCLSIGPDALEHFLTKGWLLGLDPSPLFSTCSYLTSYPDVMSAATNPLLHYVLYGEAEGRQQHLDAAASKQHDQILGVIGREFRVDFYLSQIPELALTMVDPVLHYTVLGWRANIDPTPDFSTSFYLTRHTDVQISQQNPFYHYLTRGRLEGRLCSAAALAAGAVPYSEDARLIRHAVDVEFYFTEHPTLCDSHVDAVLHYLHSGWKLGYDPSANFSTKDYLQLNAAVLPEGQNPLCHYLREGRAAGCVPKLPPQLAALDKPDLLDGEIIYEHIKADLSVRYYREKYPDMAENGLDCVQHYISYGHTEGRDPAPWFSTAYYVSKYPAVRSMRINPFFHYLIWGKAQGLRTFASDTVTPIEQRRQEHHLFEQDLDYLLLPPPPSPNLQSPAPQTTVANPQRLDIHWVIPDFDIGGGGHMTIFRMVKWLELFGHRCTIWVCHSNYARTDAERESILLRKYQIVRARVRTMAAPISGAPAFPGADALIATSWDTAYLVRSATGAAARFYFVQDYEPFFYPTGARSLAAAATYDFGLACICASPWLESMLRDRHDCWARSFPLCASEEYRPPPARPRNNVPRIAFYARETARRAVELGFLALKLLAERGVAFHVDLFGGHRSPAELPFSASNWGIADPPVLAQLYGEADIGVCFSATNYSLVPQEMMACGLPVLELDTASTRAAFPDGVVALAGPDPFYIAETLEGLLASGDSRAALAGRASTWLAGLSWERSARSVEAALHERLGVQAVRAEAAPVAHATIKASVVIPTHNGGELLRKVLASVLEQRTHFGFEVVVVDSASRDGTWEYLQSLGERVIAKRIDKSEFQHGRTRNLGISLTSGEYVALLTQDALPCDRFWLENLVVMLDRFPQAAGAFGRHVAHEDASAFTKRDIKRHFQQFEAQPICVTKYTDIERYRAGDRDFRQMLHYYSDNNACLRRSVWENIPYPEVDFGEDQLWAERIIARGYGKLYVSNACVYHSHNYSLLETLDRGRVEGMFFRQGFGYDVSEIDLRAKINRLNAEDEAWGSRNTVPAAEIEQRKQLNLHWLLGQSAAAF